MPATGPCSSPAAAPSRRSGRQPASPTTQHRHVPAACAALLQWRAVPGCSRFAETFILSCFILQE